jgi:hypothetical protein
MVSCKERGSHRARGRWILTWRSHISDNADTSNSRSWICMGYAHLRIFDIDPAGVR